MEKVAWDSWYEDMEIVEKENVNMRRVQSGNTVVWMLKSVMRDEPFSADDLMRELSGRKDTDARMLRKWILELNPNATRNVMSMGRALGRLIRGCRNNEISKWKSHGITHYRVII